MRPVADRVKETTTDTTSPYELAGAEAGFRGFIAAGYGGVSRVPICMENGADWVVGYATFTDAAPDTFVWDEITASSNNGNDVTWGAGTKYVFLTVIAQEVLDRGKAYALYNNTPTV